jgi:hypothetical protein
MALRLRGWVGLVICMCLAAAPQAAAQTASGSEESKPSAAASPAPEAATPAPVAPKPPAAVAPKPPAAKPATAKPASASSSSAAPANASAGEPKPAAAAKPRQVAKGRAKSPTVKCNVPNSAGKPYYVEFRARTAVSFGHTFVIYGRANSAGGAATWEIAGLHPAGNDPNVYAIGLVVPVPSETGPSDGDLDEEYVSARWCVRLSEADYRKMVAFIKELKSRSTLWHGSTTNCVTFVGEIARSLGLEAPSGLLYPEVYVNSIKSMNTGGSQLPNIPTVQWSTQPAAAVSPGRPDNP